LDFQHQYSHPVNKINGDGKVDKLVIFKSPTGKQNDVELGELSFFEQLTLKHFLHEAIFCPPHNVKMNFTSKNCFRKVFLNDNIYVCCDDSLQFSSFHLNASTLNQENTGKFITLLEFPVLPSHIIMNKTMKILHFYHRTENKP